MKSIGKVRGTSTVSVRIHDVYARYLLIQSLFRKNKTNLNKNTNIHKNNKIKKNIIKKPRTVVSEHSPAQYKYVSFLRLQHLNNRSKPIIYFY